MANENSFVRWQSITREHLSATCNLILGLATGLLAFQSALLLDERLLAISSFWFAIAGLLFLVATVMAGLWCTINRLQDFRLTARIVRRRTKRNAALNQVRRESIALGETTWRLFSAQLIFFAIGSLFSAIAILIQLAQQAACSYR